MNKQLTMIMRVFLRLYMAAYLLYFIVLGYQLFLARLEAPQSTIPVLSVDLLTKDAKALESRVVLPAGLQYTATPSAAFGRLEPFNP